MRRRTRCGQASGVCWRCGFGCGTLVRTSDPAFNAYGGGGPPWRSIGLKMSPVRRKFPPWELMARATKNQRFNWFESTPRNAPRLPIQTNNHTTSEPHTHVMSNENKFPLKETPIFAKNKTPDDLLTGKGGAIRADYRKSLNSGSGYVPHPNW